MNKNKIYLNIKLYTDFLEETHLTNKKLCIYTCEDTDMKNLNMNLKEITYYLIQLFYKTGKKYSCTQTKLGKLLSILAFKYARNEQLLFNESISKYPPHCGTLIEDLVFIPKDIYIRDLDVEDPDKLKIINEPFDDKAEIPNNYMDINNLSDQVKKDIEDLFRLFGSYPASKLGEYLNPIVELTVSDDNKIILNMIKTISIEDFSENELNEITKYICS